MTRAARAAPRWLPRCSRSACISQAPGARAPKRRPAVDAPAPTAWSALTPEEQKIAEPLQRALELAAGRAAAAPAARHAALAGHDARTAAERAQERYSRWKELTPEQQELARKRWHKYRELPPEQQERVREDYHRFKKLTPEQRQRLRERWQNATPEERQRCSSAAGSGWNARRRPPQTNYWPSTAPASAESSSSWCRGWPS